jgi:hypothetical protein
MKQWLRLVLGLVMIGLLAGCASSGPERDINDPANSLVFGYIDMGDAPTGVDAAQLMQVSPPSAMPYWDLGVVNGLFFNAYLPPGSYQLSSFYGSKFFAGQHEYIMPRQGNETSLRIVKPGIYFLGAYKYEKVKTGVFEKRKFAIEKTSTPTEAEVLKRVLDNSEGIRNSAWANKIRARLAQLKQ